jgi:hypothetical protein
MNSEEKKNLYYKVQNIIKYAKIEKYIKDKEEITSEGMSFFGGITGKNSLQFEKLRNVKLKIELLESQKVEKKDEYELEDLMADLYACAITEFGGKFNNDMDNIYKEIKLNCNSNKTDEEIYKLACDKINKGQSYLPIIHQEKPKGIFGDTKVQIEFLKLENVKLQNQIILERGKSQLETFSHKIQTPQIIIPISVKNGKKSLTNV